MQLNRQCDVRGAVIIFRGCRSISKSNLTNTKRPIPGTDQNYLTSLTILHPPLVPLLDPCAINLKYPIIKNKVKFHPTRAENPPAPKKGTVNLK